LELSRTLIVAVAAAGSFQIPSAPTLANDRLQAVKAYLSHRTAPFPFSGAVLVTVGDRVLLDEAYGEADLELHVSNRPTTLFRIGSLTKPFTATATMALVEHDKLALTDAVCKYVQSCPTEWSSVQISHLLSHTSGIPDLFGDVAAVPIERTRAAIDAAVQAAHNTRLDSAAGTTYAYSNFNYMLLGYIIEVASGQLWFDVVRERILKPAGLANTVYDDVWAIVPDRARGYEFVNGWRNVTYKDYAGFSAGGLLSTTHDVARFGRMFAKGLLVKPSTVADMATPRRGDYGYGWQIKHYFGRRAFNHSGGTYGFASHVAVYPEDDVVVAVLSNLENEPAKTTACNIAAMLFGSPPSSLSGCPAS
jgi:CubicO group peptidase (beta-lactamase class C family)